MAFSLRRAQVTDGAAIIQLVHMLAETMGDESRLDADYLGRYLADPRCHILVAEEDGQVIGVLSYSVRPNLYHAADSALIEELAVRESARKRGVGAALVRAAMAHARALGCAEISVSTGPENAGALRLYRSLGLTEESVLLEKHLH